MGSNHAENFRKKMWFLLLYRVKRVVGIFHEKC